MQEEYDLLGGIDNSVFDSPGTFAEDAFGGEAQEKKDTGWISVASSMIAAMRYIGAEGNMYVRFPNGAEYVYSTPENVFREMLNAPSIGSYFRRNVYTRYRYSRR